MIRIEYGTSPSQVIILALLPKSKKSATGKLGAMLKQVVDEPEGVPGETTQAYEGKKRAIGGRGQWLSDIVKKLETVASEKPPLICSDALDECVAEH